MGSCARVACDKHMCGQVGKRHVVSTRGQELNESDLPQVGIVLGRNLAREVPREEDVRTLRGFITLRRCDLVEKGARGSTSQHLTEQCLRLGRGMQRNHDILHIHRRHNVLSLLLHAHSPPTSCIVLHSLACTRVTSAWRVPAGASAGASVVQPRTTPIQSELAGDTCTCWYTSRVSSGIPHWSTRSQGDGR